jgi:hypothetical protein
MHLLHYLLRLALQVRHDHTVTWLAYWRDTISAKDFKYVFLGATSSFKADSDLQKYEKVSGAGITGSRSSCCHC